MRKARLKSKTLPASERKSARSGPVSKKKEKKKESFTGGGYDNFREEIETVRQDEEFLIELDDKVLAELSDAEMDIKAASEGEDVGDDDADPSRARLQLGAPFVDHVVAAHRPLPQRGPCRTSFAHFRKRQLT